MTDAEIIKAAELCLNNSLLAENCEKCPCKEKGNYCMDVMLRNCIDLIRRQQAEINQFADIGKLYSEVRTEAVKKFAKALKAEMKNLSKVHLFGATFALVGENFVDGFVERYEKGE